MNPKLEQLRKRYANPSTPADASGVYNLGPRSITAEADQAEDKPTTGDANSEMSSRVGEGPAPLAGIAEQNRKDGQPALEELQPIELLRGVAPLFEPARRYLDRVGRSAEAIRALRAELNEVVQSVEPLKELQNQIVEILDSVRAQISDLAASVEATKALRLQLSGLVETLDAGTELDAQLGELSRVLGGVSSTKTAKDKKETPQKTASE
jgi:hypothetical protein